MSKMNNAPINMKINITIEPKIYLIFAFLGAMLLFYNIWEIRPVKIGADSFGLMSYLTDMYWIGYILIILYSVILYMDKKEKSDIIYLTYLIVIGLFLFGIAVFAEENARFAWSYYPAGEVKTILEAKNIGKISEHPIISYWSWPGSHLISSFMIYVANIDISDLIKYMPIFWVLALIFIVYSIGRLIKLPTNQCFLASCLVLLSFWTMNYYYGPPSIAYILYMLFFFSIILLYKRSDIVSSILTILIFTAVVVTHMLTSIALMIIFIFSSRSILQYLKYIIPKIEEPIDFLYKNRMKFIVSFFIIFIAWYIYVATSMFSMGIREFVKQIIETQLVSVVNSEKYNSGTTIIRKIIHLSRISFLGIYGIIMMVSAIMYYKGKIEEKNKEFVNICFLWLIGVASMLVLRYGAEIDDRVYIFALLPMALIIVMTFDKRIVVTLMTIFAILHIPAHYGTESYDIVYTTELQGAKFVASNINSRYSISYYYGPLVRYHNPQLFNLVSTGFVQGIYSPNNESLNNSDYIVHSVQMSNYLTYIFGIDKIQTWLEENNAVSLLYDNGYYSLYKGNI